MTEAKRTLIYVVVAVCSIILAVVTNAWNTPAPVAGFDTIGEEFYPEFTDPTTATRLQVVTYNEETATARKFAVERRESGWVIPSHYDYPAEAKEQLARTAASVIGLTRDGSASRRASDHEKFGVIDPLDEKSGSLKGIGHRVVLSEGEGDNGKVLCDYIIGKQVENQPGMFYVRRADEDETYRVRLEINVSTKFEDWVEPDLLKLTGADLRQLELSKTKVDPRRGFITVAERNELNRESSTADWELTELDSETEEVQQDKIGEIVTALDNLKLVGVRPKPKGLKGDLTVELPEGVPAQLKEQFQRQFQAELERRGFYMGQFPDGTFTIVSNDGDFKAATENGVTYHLHVGSVFTGSTEEVEIGKAEAEEGEKSDDAADDKTEKKSESTDETDDDDEKNADENPSRYLMVRVVFDDSVLGPKPEEPVKPEAPESVKGEEKEAASKDDATGDDKPADDKKEEAPAKEEKSPEEIAFEKAIADYNAAKSKYDTELSEWESKAEAGREKVEELNQRFGAWYYVISDESVKSLLVSRTDLVKAKEVAADPDKTAPSNGPALPGAAPAGQPSTETPPAKPAEKEPAGDEKPAAKTDE